MPEFYITIGTFAVLMIASGFFSAAEVALFSIQPAVLEDLAVQRPMGWKYVARLLQSPRRLLITILIGNTVVNTAVAVIAALLTIQLASVFEWNETAAVVVEVIGVTFVLIVVSEVTPKVLAARSPLVVSRRVALPLYVISLLTYPLAAILVAMIRLLESKLGLHQRHTALKGEDIKTLADVVTEQGTIDEEERGIIHSMIDAKDSVVREVMTPRTDMVAIDGSDVTFEKLVRLFIEKKHSRIPVFVDSIDNVRGIVYAKDVLPLLYRSRDRKNFDLLKLCREPFFVPESKKLEELLREFQQRKTHIAIVVDEFGGTAGMVTFQDVTATIVGTGGDELSPQELMALRLGERTFRLNAQISISEASEVLGVKLESEDSRYDTLGGFLFHLFGKIPHERDTVRFENLLFTVQRVSRNRILFVLVEILLPSEAS